MKVRLLIHGREFFYYGDHGLIRAFHSSMDLNHHVFTFQVSGMSDLTYLFQKKDNIPCNGHFLGTVNTLKYL